MEIRDLGLFDWVSTLIQAFEDLGESLNRYSYFTLIASSLFFLFFGFDTLLEYFSFPRLFLEDGDMLWCMVGCLVPVYGILYKYLRPPSRRSRKINQP